MKKITDLIKHPIRMALSYIAPKTLAGIYYKNVCHKTLNWKNPQDLNEVINWLKFNGDTSMWPLLADKYKVREYVEAKGLGHILVKLYGVWNKAEDIDFDALPNSFILKTNHGCGTNIIVKDKSALTFTEIEDIRNQMKTWLRFHFGQETVEFHYLKIKPVIIAEELLINDDDEISSSLVDYKVWCFNGKAFCVRTYYNRTATAACTNTFDTKWNVVNDASNETGNYHIGDVIVPKPAVLDFLIEYAERLSAGHPQMRVDFYIINNRIYFGEITMTSSGGYMSSFTIDFLLKMGKEARKGLELLD